MENKPNAIDNLITSMVTASINEAVPVVQHGPLQDQSAGLNGTGLAAGRKVYDTVTGQWVTVVGATTAYIPQSTIDEAPNA